MSKKHSFVIDCREDGKTNIARIDHVEGPSFDCPICNLRLVYLNDTGGRHLGAQGRTEKTIKHTIRKVTEHAA